MHAEVSLRAKTKSDAAKRMSKASKKGSQRVGAVAHDKGG
jgi:hypothetical protein